MDISSFTIYIVLLLCIYNKIYFVHYGISLACWWRGSSVKDRSTDDIYRGTRVIQNIFRRIFFILHRYEYACASRTLHTWLPIKYLGLIENQKRVKRQCLSDNYVYQSIITIYRRVTYIIYNQMYLANFVHSAGNSRGDV